MPVAQQVVAQIEGTIPGREGLVDQGVVQPHRFVDHLDRQRAVPGAQGLARELAGLGAEGIERALGDSGVRNS